MASTDQQTDRKPGSNHRTFATSALSVLVARFLACVAGFGFTAILARHLTPSEFGSFVLLFSFSTLAAIIGSLGLNRAVVKLIAEQSDSVDSTANCQTIVRRGLLMGCVGGIVAGCFAAVLLLTFQTKFAFGSFAVQTVFLFAIIVSLRTVHLVLAEAARGFHEKAWSNLFGGPSGGPVPHLLFLVLLAISVSGGNMNLRNALLLYAVAFLVTLPPLVWRTLTLQANPSSDAIRQTVDQTRFAAHSTLALSLPLMLTQVGSLAMTQADIWLAGGFASADDIATYGAAQRLLAFLTIPLQIAGTAIVSYIPQLHAKGDQAGLKQIVSLASTVAGLPGIVLGIVFLAIPETVLGFAFGEYYHIAAHLLRILAIGQLICIMTGPCEMLLMMTGHQRTTLAVNTIATVILFVAAPFAMTAMGITGLAIAMSVVTSSQNLANWFFAYRKVGINTAFGTLSLKDIGINRKVLRMSKQKVTS